MTRPASVEEYLSLLPARTREAVDAIRRIAAEVLPDGSESLSYDMPTFSVGGRRVVHIGGWAQHVSLYPVPADDGLLAELDPYLSGRGTVKFPLGAPIPYELIGRVIRSLRERLT